ncbi:MAG: ATP-binding cassette domain-containing protein [Thermodesulfobacteriota bacterium]|jgi:branched-chain amino acid transport system ATP-binding protein
MSEDVVLQVKRVNKSFGGVKAVDNVSFDAFKGEILGIIGPNGSGKTTLVNLITGFVKADSGMVFAEGKKLTGLGPDKIAGLGIVRTFQIPRPYHSLSVVKNLVVPLYSSRIMHTIGGKLGDRDTVALDILEEIGFERDAHVPYKLASAFSEGYLKRLELARCLALRPYIIIMDELFSGLSVSEIAAIIPMVERLQMNGITIIMVEHRVRELFQIAHRVMVMNFGEKIAEDIPKKIIESEIVKQAYLGVT